MLFELTPFREGATSEKILFNALHIVSISEHLRMRPNPIIGEVNETSVRAVMTRAGSPIYVTETMTEIMAKFVAAMHGPRPGGGAAPNFPTSI